MIREISQFSWTYPLSEGGWYGLRIYAGPKRVEALLQLDRVEDSTWVPSSSVRQRLREASVFWWQVVVYNSTGSIVKIGTKVRVEFGER